MVDITTWFQLGTLGMFVGTVAMVVAVRRVPAEKYRKSALLVAVGAIAAVAYGLMSFGIGAIQAADGHTIYLTRYIDWLLTTPLHVVYLGLIAGVARRDLAEIAGLQALTIVLGLAGALVPSPLKFVLFLAGGLVFARVLQLLYGRVTDAIQDESDTIVGLYRKLLNFIAVLWLVYPIIWLLAPSGFGVMDLETQSLVVTYIDVVAKIGFGLIALNGQASAAYLESGAAVDTDTDTDDTAGGTAVAD